MALSRLARGERAYCILSQYQAEYQAILDIATSLSLNKLFGCWKPQKASRGRAIRTGAVFARSEVCSTAWDRITRSERSKDGTVPYKEAERRVIPPYAV